MNMPPNPDCAACWFSSCVPHACFPTHSRTPRTPESTRNPRALLTERLLSKVRRGARTLHSDAGLTELRTKIQREVENGGLKIRQDRELTADLGLRTMFLDLIFSYNPTWLRFALEAVFNISIDVNNASTGTDAGVDSFIPTRMRDEECTPQAMLSAKQGV